MFSGFFGKSKKHQTTPPSEENVPPIPGPDADSFVVVNKDEPNPATGSDGGAPYPTLPNLPPGIFSPTSSTTTAHRKEVSFLHGVPFKLSKELSGDSSGDIIGIQVNEIMAHRTQRLQLRGMDYDFAVERSVLSES